MQTYMWFGGMYFADAPGLICYWLMVTSHVKELGGHNSRWLSHNCSSMLFPVRAEEALRGDVAFKTLLQVQTTDTFRISRWAELFMTLRSKFWEPLSSQDSESWEISKCCSGNVLFHRHSDSRDTPITLRTYEHKGAHFVITFDECICFLHVSSYFIWV